MILLARALAASAALAALAGCGGSKSEPIAVGSTIAVLPKPARCAETYTIDGTIVAVSGRRIRVDIEDAGGAGEGRIATVAAVRLPPGQNRPARLRSGARVRASVHDCGSVLVAERLFR